ncbi:MAG: S9 family peptidase, partial [Chitinophagaceae bacterium]
MKKNLIISALLTIAIFPAMAQSGNNKVVTAGDYEKAAKFLSNNTGKLVDRSDVRPNWLGDGNLWYSVNVEGGKEYVLINTKDGSRKTAKDLKSLLPSATEEKSPVGRRNFSVEVISPDGKKAAFIRDWNLWIRDLESKKETQLTTDGSKDFGYATDNAGWKKSDRAILLWSPDSKKIATFQQDQRHVSDMYLVTTNVGEPKLESWKYPIPSDSDIIRIHRVIIETDVPKVIRLKIPSDARRGTLCDDISCSGSFDDNEWNADGSKLAFVSSSRDHKEAKMRIADAATGEVKEIFEEKVATQYESGQGRINWHFLAASNEIIWYSERDDWGHLYLYNATTGQLKNQITKGDFVVTMLLKTDEKNRVLFFEANGREKGRDPYFSHFYRVDFTGKNLQLLTPEDGNHTIS